MHTKDEVVSKILYFCRYDCSVRRLANVTFLGLQRQNVPILVDRHCPLMMAGREGQRLGSKAIFSMSKPTAGHFCPFLPKSMKKGSWTQKESVWIHEDGFFCLYYWQEYWHRKLHKGTLITLVLRVVRLMRLGNSIRSHSAVLLMQRSRVITQLVQKHCRSWRYL